MNDFKISAMQTAAYALWTIALALVLVALFAGVRTAPLGILTAGVAMVLQIRGFFCTFLAREQQAFQLGRDSVHSVR